MIPSTGSPCRSSGRKLEEAECEKCDLSCSSRALYAAEHCRWSRRRFCDRIGSRKRRAALRCRLHYTHTFFSPGRNCRPVVVNIVTGAFFRLVIGRVFRKLPGAILRGGIKALTAQGYRIANADRGRSRRLPNAIVFVRRTARGAAYQSLRATLFACAFTSVVPVIPISRGPSFAEANGSRGAIIWVVRAAPGRTGEVLKRIIRDRVE